jgi:hypothetical protein
MHPFFYPRQKGDLPVCVAVRTYLPFCELGPLASVLAVYVGVLLIQMRGKIVTGKFLVPLALSFLDLLSYRLICLYRCVLGWTRLVDLIN